MNKNGKRKNMIVPKDINTDLEVHEKKQKNLKSTHTPSHTSKSTRPDITCGSQHTCIINTKSLINCFGSDLFGQSSPTHPNPTTDPISNNALK